MVKFQLPITLLLASSAVNCFSRNNYKRKTHIVRRSESVHESKFITARSVSYSIDGADAPFDDDWEERQSLLEDKSEEQAEQATEQELDLRRQQLKARGSGIGSPYTVELPLFTESVIQNRRQSMGLGITLSQVSPGRVFSAYELDLDTMRMQLTPTRAEAAAEDSDTRQQRDRLKTSSLELLQKLSDNFSGLIVTSVVKDGPSWNAGVRPGDLLTAVSATIGDTLWPKSSLEGVKSAIMSRQNLVGAKTVKLKLRRLMSSSALLDSQYELTLPRPLHFTIRESTDGSGYVEVAGIAENAPNLVKYAIRVGDRIVAVGSSLGDQMWPASSTVEGVIASCTGRLPGQPVTIRFERPASLMRNVQASTAVKEERTVSPSAPSVKVPSIAPKDMEGLRARCRDVLRRYATEDDGISQRAARSLEFQAMVADKVVDALASASAEIDAYTLNMIMNSYLSSNEAAKAIKIFEASTGFLGDGSTAGTPAQIFGKHAVSRIVPTEASLNLYTVTALLRAHSAIYDFDSVRRVFLALKGKSGATIGDNKEVAPWPWTGAMGSMKPDTVCYNIVISAAEKIGGPEAVNYAFSLFDEMSAPNKNNDQDDSPIQNQVTFNTMISALANEGRSDEAFNLFERMKRLGVKPDKFTYTSLIKVCSHDGDVQELLYDMRERGIKADVVTYNTIIRSLCAKRQWTQATKIISEMESQGISPDSRTYSFLMNEMLKEGKPSACLTLFETACASSRTAILTENVYLYTTAITAASKLGDHQRALEFIARMNASGIKPNLKTLTAVLGACLASGKPDLAVQIFRRIEKPDGYAMAQGIRALCENGDLTEAQALLTQQKRDAQLITGKQMMYTYNHLLKAALERGKYDVARSVLFDLLQKGFIPNSTLYLSFVEIFGLKSSKVNVKRNQHVDLQNFQFLLFVVDSLQQRRLPLEGIVFTSVVTLGNELGGLPRRIASLLVESKVTPRSGTKLLESGSESSDEMKSDVFKGWEDLYINYDTFKKDMSGSKRLPQLLVRLAPRDLRRVLVAEKSVSKNNRIKRVSRDKQRADAVTTKISVNLRMRR